MECQCVEDHSNFASRSLGDVRELDADLDIDEAWFIQCEECDAVWLRVLFEAPHHTKSGPLVRRSATRRIGLAAVHRQQRKYRSGLRQHPRQAQRRLLLRRQGRSFRGITETTGHLKTSLWVSSPAFDKASGRSKRQWLRTGSAFRLVRALPSWWFSVPW